MADQGVHVGLNPRPITFHYVAGYPLSFSMTLRNKAGGAVAWPDEPTLFFGDPEGPVGEIFEIAAVLSMVDTVADAKATWIFSELNIDLIDELPDDSVALLSQGMPLYQGRTARHG